MNKILKIIISVLNFIMLILAIRWYNENHDLEPLISIFGQIAVLLMLIFENKVSKILTKDIDNSKVNVDVNSGDNIKTQRVKDSEITIKTK